MRILVDIRHLNSNKPAGVGGYTTQLLRALFEIDTQNDYVLLSSGRTAPTPPSGSRVEHLHLPTANKILNLKTLLTQHPTINWNVREPVDLIFLPNLNITALPQDVPTVLMLHDLSFHFFPEFYSHKMRAWHKAVRPYDLAQQATHIITPSRSTKTDVVRTFNIKNDRVTAIPHGVDSSFSPSMQARDHGVRSRLKLPKRFVLFVGTFEPRKNLIALVGAIKHYRDTYNDNLHLVLAGKWGWHSHDLRRRLWKRDTKGWVHEVEYVPQEDLPALYRSAQALVWPSIYEGFGLPVLEAMACGTPVITSHTSSLPEVTGSAAIHIDPYNIVDISEALRGLIGSQALQSRLRASGLDQARQFSWQNTAKKTLNVFEQQTS